MTDFAALRQRMVDNQIRPSAVTDFAIIDAFLSVPRELFVEAPQRPFAYSDRELAMVAGAPARRMLDPVQLARLLQLLPSGAGRQAMVVGGGTGYSAALLARLVGRVTLVEEQPELAAAARVALLAVGAERVEIINARLTEGCAEHAPYDAVLVDGAVETVPSALIEQLKPDGVLAVIEREPGISRAMLYEHVGGKATRWPQFEAWASLLPGFEKAREFVF